MEITLAIHRDIQQEHALEIRSKLRNYLDNILIIHNNIDSEPDLIQRALLVSNKDVSKLDNTSERCNKSTNVVLQ